MHARPMLWAVLSSLVFALAPVAAVEPLSDLTGPWQLLVDDHAIEQKTGLARTYHPFQKYAGNPVIRPDKPWEGTIIYMYGHVLPNETRTGYRMWYHALPSGQGNRLLYAESTDGITWTKPNLGNVLYNGNTDNNIYWHRNSGDHIASVIHTPWDAPNRQYKLINFNGGMGGWLGASSGNGTQFVDNPANPVLTGTGDVGNFVWDYHQNDYLGYVKLGAYVNGMSRRSVAITRTSDWTSWPQAQIVLKPDDIDDRWATGLRKTDFYGLCAFPYESMYIGFLWVLRVTAYIDVCQDGPIFVELVTSRDGVHWDRQEGDRPPILPLGSYLQWDAGMVFTAQQPLVEDGQIKLYYGGIDGEHCAKFWVGGIGLATLRKDGFASLDAGPEGGSLVTRKMLNTGGQLRINYRSSAGGFVLVEVLDEHGQVLPGYGAADCAPLLGDSLDQAVSWTGTQVLPAVSPVRLRFVMQDASLYSFRADAPVYVMQPPTIEQQPALQRVTPGGTVQFAVTASGEGTLEYRWQRDGADLADGGHISGTHTSTLTLSLVEVGDVGSYRCRVSNGGGVVMSAEAGLEVGQFVLSEVILPGAAISTLWGMSADGLAVCGTSDGRPVLWTPLQGARDLGLPPSAGTASAAKVILRPNGDVLAAVNGTGAGTHAWRWDGNIAGVGQYSSLPLAGGIRPWSARGMGSNGSELWIAGSSAAGGDGGGRDACMYRLSTNTTLSIAPPAGGHDHSDLHAVSDSGFAAGQFQYTGTAPSGGSRTAWLYTARRATIGMHSIAGAPSSTTESGAKCVSGDGQVLGGWSGYPGGGQLFRPVIWRTPASVVTLAFPSGPSVNCGEVLALNHDGSIAAGSAWQQSNPGNTARAFIWDAIHGTRDLGQLLIDRGHDLTGWVLSDVTGMSADGARLCGNGRYNGVARGWVLWFDSFSPARPLILRHPAGNTVLWGATASLEVEATGGEPLSYQWQLDGKDLADGTDYQGTNSPVLSVLAMHVGLEGRYRCRVANEQGQVLSHAVDLTLVTSRADFDRDGDVDQEDYGLFQTCFTGPTVPQNDPACAPALLDGDNDVDYHDLAIFLNCVSGPGVLAVVDCAD